MVEFILVVFSIFHPFHVSVCDIEYNPKNKAAEISIKVFLDDMEEGLRKMSDPKIDILKIAQSERDSLVKEYMKKRFSIRIDYTSKNFRYVGSEIEKEALWCYLEVTDLKKFKTIQVKNTVLHEVYNDQVNLVNITLDGITKSMKLNAAKPIDIISFE